MDDYIINFKEAFSLLNKVEGNRITTKKFGTIMSVENCLNLISVNN